MKKIITLIKKYFNFILLALILASALLVYKDCLKAGFINRDDNIQISSNQDIRELSLEKTSKIFKSFYLDMYQPLITLSYALEYRLVQDQPWLYHFNNLLLHLLNIILVYLLTKKLFKKNNIALLSSAIFALHPLNLESVIWVSARSTLLFSCFYLLAIIFYLNYLNQKKIIYYWITLLSFLLSLFSKNMAVTLPVILLALDYYQQRKINKKLLLEKIPFFALSVIFGLVAIKARYAYIAHVYSWPNKISLWFYSVGDYLEKLILPSRLSTFYAFPEQINGWLPWDIYLVVAGFLLLLFLLLKFKNNRTLIFLSIFYLVNLILTIQIKNFSYTIIADRYAYLAGLAVIWLIAIGYSRIIVFKPQYKHLIIAATISYLLMLGFITMNRTDVWQNNFVFWQRVVDQYPRDSYALSALGGSYLEFKNYDKALEYLEKSIAIDNKNTETLDRLGTVYSAKRNYQQAINYYNQAISINYTKSRYYYNRACAIANSGKQAEALIDYELAVKTSKPNDEFLDVYYLALANTKYKLQDYAGAISTYDTGIAFIKNPAEAYFFRGLSKIYLKKITEGCQDIAQASKLGYDDAIKNYKKLCSNI